MYTDMDWWTKIRLEILRKENSKRGVMRREGIHWNTLKKITTYSEPPGYRLKGPRPKPKIGAYLDQIAQIIESDKSLPKKQRHTAKRIYERLRELGYQGKYTQVRETVREIRRVNREVFMPLIHRPGEAQVDFGYALAKISGVLRKIAFFVMVLPYSDAFLSCSYLEDDALNHHCTFRPAYCLMYPNREPEEPEPKVEPGVLYHAFYNTLLIGTSHTAKMLPEQIMTL